MAFTVRRYPSSEFVARQHWPSGGLIGTAIVVKGVIHLFGVLSPDVVHSTLDEDFVPTTGEVVYTNAEVIANPGICHSPLGYVMSLEQPSLLSVKFIVSPDLVNWSEIGSVFSLGPGVFLGAPKIYWDDASEAFYLTYAPRTPEIVYYTQIAKSVDLVTFTPFVSNAEWPVGTCLLAPYFALEGPNATDLTMAEDAQGRVQMVYLDGDQQGWHDVRKASFRGTLSELFAEFFP